MAVNVATLTAKLKMDTKHLERGTKRANKSLKKMRGNTDAVSKGLRAMGPAALFGAAAAGAAISAFVVSSVTDFAKFDKGMREVFTLLPNITGAAMDKMTQQTKDLALEMGILPDKVVPALYQAISAGVPKENVFDFMEIASKAAIGGVTTLEVAVDGLTSVVNAFGKENITTTEAADLMFTAVRLGKTTFEELSRFMFQVNPIAAGLGIEFSNVTAALAALTAQGVPTRVASTQIRQALVELGKGGTIASDAFKKLTDQSFVDFIAKGGTVKEAFDIMKAGADDLGVGVGDLFGSVEASMAVIALTTKDGAKAFGNALDEMQASTGATEKAFETMDEGVSRAMDKLKAKFAIVKIELGEKLVPAMMDLLEAGEVLIPVFVLVAEVVAGVVVEVLKLIKPVTDLIGILGSFKKKADEAAEGNEDLAKAIEIAQSRAMDQALFGLPILTRAYDRLVGSTEEAESGVSDLTAAQLEAKRATAKIPAITEEAANAYKLFAEGMMGAGDDIELALVTTANDFKAWELQLSKAATGAERALQDSMGSIFDLFSGAPKKIKISVDKMIANIREQRAMAAEFEKAMRVLMAAGLDALVEELEKAGPAAVDQAVALAADMNKAFELELELDGILRDKTLAMNTAGSAAHLRELGISMAQLINFGLGSVSLATPFLTPIERGTTRGVVKHMGGVVPGPRGKEVAATLLGGETVIPLGGAGGVTIGELHVTLQGTFDQSDPSAARRFAVQMSEELEALNAEVA